MKKMTYLMMLVLGLTAVNGVNANSLTLEDRVHNTQDFVKDMKSVKIGGGRKLQKMAKHLKGAIKRNPDLVNKAEHAVMAVAAA